MKNYVRPAALAASAVIMMSAATAADYEADGKIWWAHIQYLADDKLEGRDTGTEGSLGS